MSNIESLEQLRAERSRLQEEAKIIEDRFAEDFRGVTQKVQPIMGLFSGFRNLSFMSAVKGASQIAPTLLKASTGGRLLKGGLISVVLGIAAEKLISKVDFGSLIDNGLTSFKKFRNKKKDKNIIDIEIEED